MTRQIKGPFELLAEEVSRIDKGKSSLVRELVVKKITELLKLHGEKNRNPLSKEQILANLIEWGNTMTSLQAYTLLFRDREDWSILWDEEYISFRLQRIEKLNPHHASNLLMLKFSELTKEEIGKLNEKVKQ